MTQYVETIRLQGGRFHLLPLHQQRMAATIREVYGEQIPLPDLGEALRAVALPSDSGIYNCRVVYDSAIRLTELAPYTPRTISSLRIVTAPAALDYHLKNTDRSALAALAAEKGECDEVIIVREGLITDTSYTNLLFKSEKGLFTPRSPLLAGTMLRHLLDSGLVTEFDLTPADILPGNSLGITHAIMINAMLPPDSAPVIPVTQIVYRSSTTYPS